MSPNSIQREIEESWKRNSNVTSFRATAGDQRGGAMVYKTQNGVVVVASIYSRPIIQMSLEGSKREGEIFVEDDAGDLNTFEARLETHLKLAVDALSDFLTNLAFDERFPWVEFVDIDDF